MGRFTEHASLARFAFSRCANWESTSYQGFKCLGFGSLWKSRDKRQRRETRSPVTICSPAGSGTPSIERLSHRESQVTPLRTDRKRPSSSTDYINRCNAQGTCGIERFWENPGVMRLFRGRSRSAKNTKKGFGERNKGVPLSLLENFPTDFFVYSSFSKNAFLNPTPLLLWTREVATLEE